MVLEQFGVSGNELRTHGHLNFLSVTAQLLRCPGVDGRRLQAGTGTCGGRLRRRRHPAQLFGCVLTGREEAVG